MTTSYLNQRLYGVGLSMILVASAAVMPAVAQDAPAGQVQFEVYKAGFIVGVSGGKGTLTFEGEDYPLSIGGVSLGATVSLSKAEFVGDAFNLTKAEDIEGVYSGAGAGAALAGGGNTAILKNSKGVELKVSGEQMGVDLSLDLSGMSVKIKQ
jgi:hypothetical protein